MPFAGTNAVTRLWAKCKSAFVEKARDVVGMGSSLAEGADLDGVLDLGVYASSGANAATLLHCPVSVGFKLVVSSPVRNSSYVAQELVTYTGLQYWRYHNGTSWSDWIRRPPAVSDAQAANKVLASPNGSAGFPSYRSLASADLPTVSPTTDGAAATVEGLALSLTTHYYDFDSYGRVGTDHSRSLSWRPFDVAAYNVLTKLGTVHSSVTLSSATLYVSGLTAQLVVGVTVDSQLAAGTSYQLFRLGTGIRPAANACATGGNRAVGTITDTGYAYARPTQAIPAQTDFVFSSTYILPAAYSG